MAYIIRSLTTGSSVSQIITTLYGGSAANDDLTLEGTSHVTKTTSYVLLQPSGGNVGIGTTAPDGTLEVNLGTAGQFRLSYNDADGSAANYAKMEVSSAGKLTLTTVDASAAAGHIALMPDGNVGIGTTAPDSLLHVSNSTTANTATVQQLLTLSANSTGTAAAGFGSRTLWELASSTTADQTAAALDVQWSDATHATRTSYIAFSTVNSAAALAEQMRITGEGYVGIGTTPTSRLHVTETATQTSSSYYMVNLVYSINPSGTSSATHNPMRVLTSTAGSSQMTGNVQALNLAVQNANTNATGTANLYGIIGECTQNSATGKVGTLYGGAFTAAAIAAGEVSSIIGLTATAYASSTGTIAAYNAIYGVSVTSRLTATCTSTISALHAIAINSWGNLSSAGGTVGVANGILVSSPSVTGTVTTAYGLKVSDITGAGTNYAIVTNAGTSVFNEGGDASTDFRVESDTEANMLFVDANANTDGSVYLGGTTNGIEIKKGGDLTLLGTAKYERHIQIDAKADGAVANQPAQVDFFTVGGLQYATTGAKFAFCQWEVPDDWDGGNVYFEVDWFPDSGAISGTDAVRWTVEYRAIAEGEAINNGTSVTLDNGAGGDTGDYAQYVTKHSRMTLAYDDANQPLTKQDHVYFKISRDTSVANDFGGTVTVAAYEIIYTSTGFPTSN